MSTTQDTDKAYRLEIDDPKVIEELLRDGLMKHGPKGLMVKKCALPELVRRGLAKPISLKEAMTELTDHIAKDLRNKDRDMSEADAVRYVAGHIISMMQLAMKHSLSAIMDAVEKNSTEPLRGERPFASGEMYFVLEELFKSCDPLRMRPWVYVETMIALVEKRAQQVSATEATS
jgi:hypothetical protein